MSDFLGRIFGVCFRYIYDLIVSFGTEPESISFYAITIIITTILFRILQLPLGIKQNKEMKKMARVQPKINEIQEKYKNDPQTMNAKLTKLMQEEKYNPLGGCLPLLIQLPIFTAYWKVLQNPETYIFADGIFKSLQLNFFWINDLKVADPWILPIISAVATFATSYIAQKGQVKTQVGEAAQQAETMQKTMLIMMPIMIFSISKKMAAGIALYWSVSNLFQIGQQLVFNMTIRKEAEEAVEQEEQLKLEKRKKKG